MVPGVDAEIDKIAQRILELESASSTDLSDVNYNKKHTATDGKVLTLPEGSSEIAFLKKTFAYSPSEDLPC